MREDASDLISKLEFHRIFSSLPLHGFQSFLTQIGMFLNISQPWGVATMATGKSATHARSMPWNLVSSKTWASSRIGMFFIMISFYKCLVTSNFKNLRAILFRQYHFCWCDSTAPSGFHGGLRVLFTELTGVVEERECGMGQAID